MKQLVLLVAVAAMLAMTSGCANGPMRQWFKGGACNSCQPPCGQPYGCGTNTATGCESGTCGAPASLPASSFGGEVPYYSDSPEMYGAPAGSSDILSQPTVGPVNGG